MMTLARALLLLATTTLASSPGCKGKDKDREEKKEPAPAADDKKEPAPAEAPAAGWKRVDLHAEGNKSGVSSLSGSIEVPPDAVLDFGTSKGLDDLPVDSVFVTAGPLKVSLDVGPGSADMPVDLATYLKKVKVAEADVLEKAEPAGGYAVSYRSEGNIAVVAVYADLSCAATLDPNDAAQAKAAFRVCASYQPPAR